MTREEFPDGTEIAGWYVRAVKTGPFVFVAGTTSLDAKGKPRGKDAGAQTRITMSKIARALREAGAGMQHVTRLTIYCTDIRDGGAITTELARWIKKSRCASTLVAITALAVPGLLVEIEATAVVTDA
ncbi:RidA family protein [Vineibacter terrae]|uniref:RidA family protein n=1 Tax=Vineibacter terrae TaxID=2586908 RepID=A0A5C8PNZ8_9HYPH|nr:Rid family hydrolase [Vineibacter terrae]TXL75923.1 RidA family protein [Vineibacter terrae]HEX2891004.1 Rid family hydrolase [Vineibacter terrae]